MELCSDPMPFGSAGVGRLSRLWRDPAKQECVVVTLGFIDELANHCCMLQAARISHYPSFLDTGIDEFIGEQVCC